MSTIYALASGPVPSGVAIIRVSGPRASHAVKALTAQSQLPAPRTLSLRTLSDPKTAKILDRGMVAWFPSPRSFTGEEIAEFHVHGGRAVVQGVMSVLRDLPHFALAERGEFTRRAFERGKLDLLQVEAVADVVAANTNVQLEQALHQAGGAVSQKYESWRAQIIRMLSHVEASIDFGDDEDDVDDLEILHELQLNIATLRNQLKETLEDRRGVSIRDGVRVAIVGPPNAGKSTLLNLLASRDVAIVSDIPGTTRDVIEVRVNVGGYNVLLSDTAGVRRETDDVLERAGMERAEMTAHEADMVLCMFDIETLEEDVLDIDAILERRDPSNNGSESRRRPPVIVAANKMDITGLGGGHLPTHCHLPLYLRSSVDVDDFHYISCHENIGIKSLIESLEKNLINYFDQGSMEEGGGRDEGEPAFVTRERHRVHLAECEKMLASAMLHMGDSHHAAVELAAEDLRLAASSLGRIGGKIDPEEILDAIFFEFCIGK